MTTIRTAVLALVGLLGCSRMAMAEITVDLANVIREVPPTFHGTNIHAHDPNFATGSEGIPFQADASAARVKVIRTLAYPDNRRKDHDLSYFDRNVSAILKCGARPLFIQYVQPGLAYYLADGSRGTAENPGTPESNLVAMVRHYLAEPFNLKEQIWEVGNEPDYRVDYKMTVEDYAAQFNRVHQALVSAGLRDHVILCGPVVANLYWARATNPPPITAYIDAFLEKCSAAVDIVDMHTYCTFGAKHEELLGLTRIDKLEGRFVVDRPSTPAVPYDGMAALMAKLDAMHFARPDVGLAITEYGAANHDQALTGGLWNLAATQINLYNPRVRIMTSFILDTWAKEPDTLAHYGADKQRNDLYWALWIGGNLRGDKVLARQVTGNAMPDGRPFLLVGATRDARNLYIEVINRSTSAITDKIAIHGGQVTDAAEVFTMAKGVTPEKGTPAAWSADRSFAFPAASATIIRVKLAN